MKDNLKNFIDHHREDFDDLKAPDLWASISAGMQAPSGSFIHLKKFGNMFKFGIGASALIIGSFFILNSLVQNKTSVVQVKQITPAANVQTVTKKTDVKSSPIKTEPIPEKITKPVAAIKEMSTVPGSGISLKNAPAPTIVAPDDPAPAKPSPSSNIVSIEIPDTNSAYSIDTLFNGITNLIVKGNYCTITISGKEREDVSLKGNVSREFGETTTATNEYKKTSRNKTREKIKYSINKSTLTVWLETEVLSKNKKAADKVKGEQGLYFEVPVNTHVTVDNHFGDIQVSDIKDTKLTMGSTFGDIKAKNINAELDINSICGDITLSNIAGYVLVHSSAGKQSLDQISGDVKLISQSGDVSVKNLNGNADVTSTFGNQTFENVKGNILASGSSGDVKISKASGNINSITSFGVQIFEEVVGNITAKASSGDIRLEDVKGILVLNSTMGNISGKKVQLLTSGNFTTSSGDINIEFLNEVTELSFDLATSAGDLEINKGSVKSRSGKKLNLANGPILVKGDSDFGNQKYR